MLRRSRYRSAEEVDQWAARDPIARFEAYLRTVGVWSDRLAERTSARSARMRSELRGAVFDAPDADISEVFDNTFADMTTDLADQRRRLLVELAKGERE